MFPTGVPRTGVLLLACGVTMGLAASGAPGTTNGARQVQYAWKSWTREHGLPDNRVKCLLQTRDGYLWIGTRTGLARFDGNRFTVFNRANTPEMLSEDCRVLAEDGEGGLWIGTAHGVLRRQNQRFTRFTNRDGLCGKEVNALLPTRSGALWIGTDGGLSRFLDGRFQNYTHQSLPDVVPSNLVLALFEDGDESVWVGFNRGLLRYDPVANTLVQENYPPAVTKPLVSGICRDAAGRLWVAMAGGDGSPIADLRFRISSGWDKPRGHLVKVGTPETRAASVVVTRDGELWVTGLAGQLISLHNDGPHRVTLPTACEQDTPLALVRDHEGALWIGLDRGGLLVLRPHQLTTLSGLSGSSPGDCWTLCESREGDVWLGTDNGVARLKNGRVTSYTTKEGLSKDSVRSIVEDRNGRLWIGTGAGLNWFAGGLLHRYHFPGEWFQTKIRALLAGPNDVLWAGTALGLHQLKLSNDADGSDGHAGANGRDRVPPFETIAFYSTSNGLRSDDVCALLEDRSGRLWVGTLGGGLHQIEQGRVKPLGKADGLAVESVWALHEDAEGALWIGSERGLARWRDGRFVLFTPRHGLPEDVVNHIVEDEFGRIWLGGDQGIYRIRKRELDAVAEGQASAVHCVSYDEDDGLLSSETNGQKNQPGAGKLSDGQVWFATTQGVAVFDPRRLPDITNPPPVVIERIAANGQTLFDNGPASLVHGNSHCDLRSEFALSAGSGRILEIYYTAVAFFAADKARFKYRLIGLEKEWTDAGTRRVAQYANLKPGRYSFEVLAANKYGVWTKTTADFAFALAPFFWQTWWFKALCVALPVLAGAGFYRWRLLQHRRLADAERRAALASERADIARDLHDHLGARITLMQHLSESLDGVPASGRGAAPAQLKLARLAGELNASLDSAVWAVQPDKDTLLSLADYLGDSFHDLLAGTRMELELDFPSPIPEWPLSRSERYHLALVAIEALNNILKHARATQVLLRLELKDESFRLCIADNGCGFDSEEPKQETGNSKVRNNGNGLENMRRRIERLGGEFHLTARPGHGVTITIAMSPSAIRSVR